MLCMLALDWASAHGDDTLILVVADHNHPVGLIGTIKDDMATDPAPLRERVRVYDRAGFPNYPAPDGEGYPPRVDVSRRLALFSAGLPDHYETGRPEARRAERCRRFPARTPGTYVANDKYKDVPGAVLRPGNLPAMINADVHSGEDVILTATGPGSERVHGQMDNTEVFRVMAEALGLSHPDTGLNPIAPRCREILARLLRQRLLQKRCGFQRALVVAEAADDLDAERHARAVHQTWDIHARLDPATSTTD